MQNTLNKKAARKAAPEYNRQVSMQLKSWPARRIRATRKAITESRCQGKTDGEIYTMLRKSSEDKELIVHLITHTPTDENVAKYKWYWYVMIVVPMLVLVPVLMLYRQQPDLYSTLVMFSVLYFVTLPFGFYHIAKRRYIISWGGTFTSPVAFSIGFLASVTVYLCMEREWILSFYGGVVLALMLLEGYVLKKTFSRAVLKKDPDGEYIL